MTFSSAVLYYASFQHEESEAMVRWIRFVWIGRDVVFSFPTGATPAPVTTEGEQAALGYGTLLTDGRQPPKLLEGVWTDIDAIRAAQAYFRIP